jgi:hypothetical protein
MLVLILLASDRDNIKIVKNQMVSVYLQPIEVLSSPDKSLKVKSKSNICQKFGN